MDSGKGMITAINIRKYLNLIFLNIDIFLNSYILSYFYIIMSHITYL